MEWFMNSSTLLLTWASGPTDLQTADQNKATLSLNPGRTQPIESKRQAGTVSASLKMWKSSCVAGRIRTKMFLNNVKIREPQECTPFH